MAAPVGGALVGETRLLPRSKYAAAPACRHGHCSIATTSRGRGRICRRFRTACRIDRDAPGHGPTGAVNSCESDCWMTNSVVDQHALEELDVRLKMMLPKEYQDSYESLQPVSMGSAGLKYDADGKVAWN